MEQRKGAIGIAVNPYLGLDVVVTVAVGGNLQPPSFETDTVVLTHGALILLAQYVVQGAAQEGDEGRPLFPRRVAEFLVEGRPVNLFK